MFIVRFSPLFVCQYPGSCACEQGRRFLRQILTNSAAQFVKFREIRGTNIPKYPTFHGQLTLLC